MKTPDEYLDEFSTDTTTKGRVKAVDAIAAIRAAVKDACREQREICARAIWPEAIDNCHELNVLDDAELRIKNAPEPKLI